MVFRSILFAAAFSLTVYYLWYKPKFKTSGYSVHAKIPKSSEEFYKLQLRATSIKKYVSANHYSNICFLIDMKVPSGKERFFVYDLRKDSILAAGLVAHGSCDRRFQFEAIFSNKTNSGCSCLGRFRVGKSYNGRFGLAYKLYGLDSCNSNAFERNIVLHSYKCVPELETYPLPICNSRGCPMVSVNFLKKLRLYLNNSERPILLNIFY
jgi:hypothetical protein